MSEGISGLWQELGISAETTIVVLVVLYFVIKWAKNQNFQGRYYEKY